MESSAEGWNTALTLVGQAIVVGGALFGILWRLLAPRIKALAAEEDKELEDRLKADLEKLIEAPPQTSDPTMDEVQGRIAAVEAAQEQAATTITGLNDAIDRAKEAAIATAKAESSKALTKVKTEGRQADETIRARLDRAVTEINGRLDTMKH